MNINLVSHSLHLLGENILVSWTSQQKTILVVALAALACLGACFNYFMRAPDARKIDNKITPIDSNTETLSTELQLVGASLLKALEKETVEDSSKVEHKEQATTLEKFTQSVKEKFNQLFTAKQGHTLETLKQAAEAKINERFSNDQIMIQELVDNDLPAVVKFADFVAALSEDPLKKPLETLAADIFVTLVDRLLPRLQKCTGTPDDLKDKKVELLPDNTKDNDPTLNERLIEPAKTKFEQYLGEVFFSCLKNCFSQKLPQQSTITPQPLHQTKPAQMDAPAPRARDIDAITSGKELAEILSSSEHIQSGLRINVKVTEQAVIEYLKDGGPPELVGTYFYCLDLRIPIFYENAEAIIRHAPRLVEVQGLDGASASHLIPLLADCEDLKHLHLEVKWGEDIDLSPLANHALGRVTLIGEGLTEKILKSLNKARIEKLRVPPALQREAIEYVVNTLKPGSISFWNHFAGKKTEDLLKSKGYQNLCWSHGIVPMSENPKNLTISPYLDPAFKDRGPSHKISRHVVTVCSTCNELEQALAAHDPNERTEIAADEHAVIAYLKQGGDPKQVGNFFRCLDLRKPTLAQHAEAIIQHAPRLMEVQGLTATTANTLLPLIAKYSPKLKHIHIDIDDGVPPPDFTPLKGRKLGSLTLLGRGVNRQFLEKLKGFDIDGLYVPAPTNSQTDLASALVEVKPGKLVFWHAFAPKNIETIIERHDYQNLAWNHGIGVAKDYEANGDIIILPSTGGHSGHVPTMVHAKKEIKHPVLVTMF